MIVDYILLIKVVYMANWKSKRSGFEK